MSFGIYEVYEARAAFSPLHLCVQVVFYLMRRDGRNTAPNEKQGYTVANKKLAETFSGLDPLDARVGLILIN